MRRVLGPMLLAIVLVAGLATSTAAAATRATISGYAQYSGQVYAVEAGQRPYDTTTVTPVDGYGVVDSTGVRMIAVGGKLHNQPVSQGAYAVENLNSYRLTGNAAYLHIAERNAQRLIDIHKVSDGAWYYPYDYDRVVVGDKAEPLRAPWYSGMAQGRALTTFVRLYQATGDEKWRNAADATFVSMHQAPQGTAPFAVHVDTHHRLWLEEYPRYPVANSEQVLNGHIAALFGLLDYWQLTADPTALRLIRGSLETVRQTDMTAFRRIGASSRYSLRHKTPAGSYHQLHVEQLLGLYTYTHDPLFAAAAAAYRSDYPKPAVTGTVQATTRTTTLYKVNSSGVVTGSKRVSFSRWTQAPTDHRQRLSGGPIGLRVSAGPYKGWWFPESFGNTWVLGAVDVHHYAPQLTVHIGPGSFSAYRMDTGGHVVGSRTLQFTSTTNVPTKLSAIAQGRSAYYFETGPYAGYWLPMQRGVHM